MAIKHEKIAKIKKSLQDAHKKDEQNEAIDLSNSN